MVQPWTYTIFSVTLDHLLIIWWIDWVSQYVDPGSVGLAHYCQSRFPFSGYSPYPKRKAMATHSSILAWKIPWMEEPGGLQSMESRRVRHDWATSWHVHNMTYQWWCQILASCLNWCLLDFSIEKFIFLLSYILPCESKSLSLVRLFVVSWTIQSMEFSRPEYWSG